MSEQASDPPKTVLVAGISGSGKSAVAKELRQRGFTSFDADEVDGLARWEEQDGRAVERPRHPSQQWLEHNFWNWDEARLKDLLASSPPPLFVCGSASNQIELINHFDVVVLLELDRETMLRRLADPDRTNDFGASEGAREALMSWLDNFQADLRKQGAVSIDANQPVPVVVRNIVELASPDDGTS